MSTAYIVEAVRSPIGRRRGGLADVHPVDLGAHVLEELIQRAGIDSELVDDVIFGCLDQVGPQSQDIARNAWLAAGLSEAVPGTTIDRQCGSSQQAVHFAAQAVMSGTQDMVVAGGVQNMSMIPIGASSFLGEHVGAASDPYTGSERWAARYGTDPVTQFRGADMMIEKWGFDRPEMEKLALESHRRAIAAINEGRFEREIAPYRDVKNDEGPRADTSLEKLASLKTISPESMITAGIASQISDGAAALLVASERAVDAHGLTPRARIHHMSVRGDDPIMMLSAPITATQFALERAGMSLDEIDLVEINEAFAPVVLAWMHELKADPTKVNVNGGAMALGHPLGASGARLMVTLLHELERSGGRFGLQTMCEGGGQANVTIIERV